MSSLADKSVISPELVGRSAEIEGLRQLLQDARQSRGRLALVVGEAGIGKSRLVSQARNHAEHLGLLTLEGHCFEADRNFPFAPLLDALRQLAASRSIDELARELGPSAHVLAQLLPELAGQFGGTGEGAIGRPTLDPETEKRRLFDALAQILLRLAAPQADARSTTGLLLILEDLHWSDETSLDFLLYWVRYLAPQPVLLLLTFRREQTSPSLAHFLTEINRTRFAVEFVLAPLAREHVDAMLRAIFGLQRPVRVEFLDPVYQLTEGNPFFIEEVLKGLIASGEIFIRDGTWDRKAMEELHIPRSVQDAVQRRLELLSPATRRVLALASVIGRRFDFALLQAQSGLSESELLDVMKELLVAELVVEESDEQFAFRHALAREAVYAMLLRRERKAYHRGIAEQLERAHSDASGTQPSSLVDLSTQAVTDLAYHFYRAGVWDKALMYSQRAGEQAQRGYAPHKAIEHYTHALQAAQELSLAPPLPLLRARGQAYETVGDFEHARADYEQAASAAQLAENGAGQWQSLIDLGFLWAARDYSKTGDYFHRALDLARNLGEPALIASSLNRVGNWKSNADQALAGLEDHREALAVFQTLNDRQGTAQTLDLLGLASYNVGDLVGGSEYLLQAVALFRELDDREGLSSSLAMRSLGDGWYTTCTLVPAVELHQGVSDSTEALALAGEIGWRSGEAFALIPLSACLGALGDFGAALDAGQRSFEIAQEINHRQWEIFSQLVLTWHYLELLAAEEARRLLAQLEPLVQELGSLVWIRNTAALVADGAMLEHDLATARRALDHVLGPTAATSAIAERVCWYMRARLAHLEGQDEYALDIIEQLIAAAPNVSSERIIPILWKLRGEVRAALKDFDAAEMDLDAARTAARAQGNRALLWRTHLALGRVLVSRRQRAHADAEFSAARIIVKEMAVTLSDQALRARFLERAEALFPSPLPLTPRLAAKREFGSLTERERQVASGIAAGWSNRQIAKELVLSEYTVATHVSNILNKLGFASRTQIAAWATEIGLAKPKTR